MKTTTLFFIYLCLFILSGVKLQAQTNIFPSTGSTGIDTTTPLASAALEMKCCITPRHLHPERIVITSIQRATKVLKKNCINLYCTN